MGNSGDLLEPEYQRIQPPSDSVNCLAVGAANSASNNWERADYSSIGPGRRPGYIKPDLLHFGGSDDETFKVFASSPVFGVYAIKGTSFAAPAALRLAAGIRAHFGPDLSTLVLKALLIHSAENENEHSQAEVGWGRIPNSLDSIVLCADRTVRVVYQGEIEATQSIRAEIPLPSIINLGKKKVGISATFCYASKLDVQDPGNYTRSGLDVTFRPHDKKIEIGSVNAKTKTFFSIQKGLTEQELRRDAHKWETTLNAKKNFLGNSLQNPVFDIHHVVRESGATSNLQNTLKYALVVTVTAPDVPDLYDKVVRAYTGKLKAFAPIIQIPIQNI